MCSDKSKKNKVIQIPADDTLYKNIKKLAELDERSIATYCKIVLQKHVEDVLGINARELQIQDLKKEYIEVLKLDIQNEIQSTDNLIDNTSEPNKETVHNNTQKKKKKLSPMKANI